MTPARLAALERSINSTMRKVLDAVPIQEHWNVHQIGGEMSRTGKRLEMQMIVGCLNALKRDGLVKEPVTGSFTRVVATPRTPQEPIDVPLKLDASSMITPPPPAPTDPLLDLEALARDLMDMSERAEKIALALRQRAAEAEQQMAKFKQFQELLKGMT